MTKRKTTKTTKRQDEYAYFKYRLFYGELCDAVYRGAHPEIPEDDGFMHTSAVARRTANRVITVLEGSQTRQKHRNRAV